MREDRPAHSSPAARVRAASGLGASRRQVYRPIVRNRVHQHGPDVHAKLVDIDGRPGAAAAVEPPARYQQDNRQPAGSGIRVRCKRRPPSGRASDEPVEQRGRSQPRRGGSHGGGDGRGKHHPELVPEDVRSVGVGDTSGRRPTYRRRVFAARTQAACHYWRRRRVRGAEVAGGSDVRRRTSEGVAAGTGHVQTGQTTNGGAAATAPGPGVRRCARRL